MNYVYQVVRTSQLGGIIYYCTSATTEYHEMCSEQHADSLPLSGGSGNEASAGVGLGMGLD